MMRKTRWGLVYFSLALFSRRPYGYDFRFPSGCVEDRSRIQLKIIRRIKMKLQGSRFYYLKCVSGVPIA